MLPASPCSGLGIHSCGACPALVPFSPEVGIAELSGELVCLVFSFIPRSSNFFPQSKPHLMRDTSLVELALQWQRRSRSPGRNHPEFGIFPLEIPQSCPGLVSWAGGLREGDVNTTASSGSMKTSCAQGSRSCCGCAKCMWLSALKGC